MEWNMRKFFPTTILAALALAMAGCGGGGDDAFQTPDAASGGTNAADGGIRQRGGRAPRGSVCRLGSGHDQACVLKDANQCAHG